VIVDVLVALLVVGAPVLAGGVLLAPLCGQAPAGWVLGPVAALGLLVLGLRALDRLGVEGAATTWLVLAAGVAAAVAAAARRRDLRPFLAPGAAALVVVALLAWPLVDRGDGAILGYNLINDSGYHATIANWVAEGAPPVPLGSSTYGSVASYEAGYPAGAHQLVALAVPLSPNGVWSAYQPVLAVLVALGTFPAAWALLRIGASSGLAAIGGVLAAAGYLQYAFYSEALLPQMAATPLVFGALALATEAALERRVAPLVLGALTGLAAGLVYSLGVGVYLAPVFAVALAVLVLRSPRRTRLLLWGTAGTVVLAAVALVALRPLVDQSVDFIREARSVIGDANPAHLPGPADRRLIWGSWVGPDFRYPYERWRVTEIGMAIAVGLALLGLVWCAWRRQLAPLALLAGALGGYLVIRNEAGIYWVAKSYQVLAYAVAVLVVAGAATLVRLRPVRWPALGAVLAAVLLAGYGVAAWRSLESARAGTAYSNPEIEELGAFADTASRGLGVGLVWDDLAKVELETMWSQFDYTYVALDRGYAPGRDPGMRVADVDLFAPGFLDRYDYVVERRLGGLSQPPPPFALAGETDTFRLWRRPAPGPLPVRVPAEAPDRLGGVVLAPGADAELADPGWDAVDVGVRPLDGLTVPLRDFASAGTMWMPWEGSAGIHYVSVGPGAGPATYDLELAVPGRYRIAVVGSMSETFELRIDGRVLRPPVATRIESRDGGQYLDTLELEAGRHRVELWSPEGIVDATAISFVQAVSFELEQRPAPAPVCVNGQEAQASWDRPVRARAEGGRVVVANCGPTPLLLDWVQPAA
jgi:hypothetical protein